MLFVIIVSVLGLLTVVVALHAQQEPLPEPGPAPPDWDGVPTPSDLARVSFPLRVPGYDPATVDATFHQLAQAYGDLLAESDPATVARARRRSLRRMGLDPDTGGSEGAASTAVSAPTEAHPTAAAATEGEVTAPGEPRSTPAGESDQAALRAAAALDAIHPDPGGG
jgi:hypothetical protein